MASLEKKLLLYDMSDIDRDLDLACAGGILRRPGINLAANKKTRQRLKR